MPTPPRRPTTEPRTRTPGTYAAARTIGSMKKPMGNRRLTTAVPASRARVAKRRLPRSRIALMAFAGLRKMRRRSIIKSLGELRSPWQAGGLPYYFQAFADGAEDFQGSIQVLARVC